MKCPYLAQSRAVNASIAKCNIINSDGLCQVDDTSRWYSGKRRSLLMAGDDDKVFMTRSLNVAPKAAEQHLIVRSGNPKPKYQ